MKRYTIIFFLFVCLGFGAFGQQKITLQADKQPVLQVLKQIEEQSGYTFSYNPELLRNFPPVTLNLHNADIDTALKSIFGETDVQFLVRDKHIILKKRPKNITISGFIHDAASRETLIAANVFDMRSRKGAVSNNFGFFSLTLPPQVVSLRASYVGYETAELALTAHQDTVVHFFLQPSSLLQEVVIEGKQTLPLQNLESGKMTLNAQTLQTLPSFLGEKDVIKALQLMPGVAAGTEGVAGMYVRGGNLDENLYLVDGNPLYHVNHLGGIFSTFNPEAVKTMDFYKGNFPARYGGRLSSVVDVRMNDGDMQKFSGTASIGLISSRFNIQGPIIKDRTSFTVSLRRTYLDLLARPTLYFLSKQQEKESPNNHQKFDVGYYFYDFNAKINHKFSDKSRIFLSIYDGKDKFFFNHRRQESRNQNITHASSAEAQAYNDDINQQSNFDMGWGTRMASLNWAYAINNRLFSNATLVYSRYSSDIAAVVNQERKFTVSDENSDNKKTHHSKIFTKAIYGSGITDMGYRLDFDYTPVHNHAIRFGTSLLHHAFRPEESKAMARAEDGEKLNGDTITFANEKIGVKELSLYVEDEMSLGQRLKMNAGVHFSGFFVQGKSYLSAQPRVSAQYFLSDDWSVKAAYGKMNQYVHLLQNSHINLPTDLWVPITKNIKPLESHQISAGVFGRLHGFHLSLEGYYKSSKNQVEYKEGAEIMSSNLNWQERVTQGLGKSYGMELMAQKTFGKTSGWLGYTLSWAERHFPNGDINKGNPYPAKYDNRHKINIMLSHKFNKKFDVSATWVYATGNWTTLSTQKTVDADGFERPYYDKRNNFKMPSYQRLDLSFNYYRHKKNGRMGIWNLSVYNAYAHHNTFLVIPEREEIRTPVEGSDNAWTVTQGKPIYKSLAIFPIIPTISYTYKF